MSDKPFVTATHAARLLGVDVSVVVSEITDPREAAALVGGMYGGVPIVYAHEVEEPRLAMHRARLERRASTPSVGPKNAGDEVKP